MIIMNALHLIVTILISFRQKHNVLIEIALGRHITNTASAGELSGQM